MRLAREREAISDAGFRGATFERALVALYGDKELNERGADSTNWQQGDEKAEDPKKTPKDTTGESHTMATEISAKTVCMSDGVMVTFWRKAVHHPHCVNLCIAEHEAVHRGDLKDACIKMRKAKPGKEYEAALKEYEDAIAKSECNAYKKSKECFKNKSSVCCAAKLHEFYDDKYLNDKCKEPKKK